MRYHDYGIEDFVKDPFFQRWVLSPDAESNGFWLEWSQKNPDKRLIVEEASRVIHLLGFTSDNQVNEKLLQTWRAVDEAWGGGNADVTHRSISGSIVFKAAAAIIIIAISTATIWSFLHKKVTIQTGFGETRAVSLPDGSVVELNANSSLAFPDKWNNHSKREVWLSGEAFFSVSHDPDKAFVVHTQGGVHVNVLGTTFNVLSRRKTTRVSLNTGRLKVHLTEEFLKQDMKTAEEGFVMLPGEVAEFNGNTREVYRREEPVARYDSWKEKRLVFDNTSMKEVAVVLEDIYGLTVRLDESLEHRKITGDFKSDDLNILLQFIARALDAGVTRNSEAIRFEAKAKR